MFDKQLEKSDKRNVISRVTGLVSRPREEKTSKLKMNLKNTLVCNVLLSILQCFSFKLLVELIFTIFSLDSYRPISQLQPSSFMI